MPSGVDEARRLASRIWQQGRNPPLHGLIQHAFALQIDHAHRPFRGATSDDRVRERFELKADGFGVHAVDHWSDGDGPEGKRPAGHSPLVEAGRTSLYPISPPLLSAAHPELPDALGWAATAGEPPDQQAEEVRFLFAQAFESGEASHNDFLVEQDREAPDSDSDATRISRLLLEIIAHRRSRLFGLCLANRIVNVMLPHVLLSVVDSAAGRRAQHPSWFLQPLVSTIRDGQNERELRSTYTLTLFLVPIAERELGARKVDHTEIEVMINAGWSLAASPPVVPRFHLEGPLTDYVARLARGDLTSAPWPTPAASPGSSGAGVPHSLSLRQATETIAFGIGLRMAEGPTGRAKTQTKRRIADDVVTALGSSRVSSVVVVDPTLTEEEVGKPVKKNDPPGLLPDLMDTLSGDPRAPGEWTPIVRRRYRLDRPFVDEDTYAVGVLPHNRCLIVASAERAQHGFRESALMQAGSVAYMTIGAANAIGTMRAISRDLEKLEDADPSRIAAIEAEIAADVHEIFDLDITRETYRQLYHRLRDRLGIVDDYRTLQDKMGSLYRATSTVHEEQSQRQLAVLTAAIVVLSVLILIGTVVLAVKPGGG